MYYDTILFTEILDSIPDIKFLRNEMKNGVKYNIYENKNGEPVFIDVSEEEISPYSGKGHLRKLLLEDLISAMFPEETQEIEIEQTEDIESSDIPS